MDLDEEKIIAKIEAWVKTWWVEAPRPPSIEVGQIWTLFGPGAQPESEGTMVGILSVDDDYLYIVPMHTELAAATGCEPVLSDHNLPFKAPLVAVVEAGMLIHRSSLDNAVFLGSLAQNAMGELRDSFVDCHRIMQSLAKLQSLEAQVGPEGLTDDQITAAFESGILKLVPPKLTNEEFMSFQDALLKNVLPYHDQAMESLFAETEPESDLVRQPERDVEMQSVKEPAGTLWEQPQLPPTGRPTVPLQGPSVGLWDLLNEGIRKIAQMFPPLPQPAFALVPAMEEMDRLSPPKGIDNPIDIKCEFPCEGGQFQILPAPSELEAAKKLDHVLWYILISFKEYFFGVLVVGQCGILRKLPAQPLSFPEIIELNPELEPVYLDLPKDVTGILVALSPDKEAINSAFGKLGLEKFQPSSPILWVRYVG